MTSAVPTPTPHGWDSDSLFAKAQRYADEMLRHDRDDWRCAFWSSLTLELLTRAALAKVSPTLLADPNSWHNLYHALGHSPSAQKFIPQSIKTTEVLNRLQAINPKFDKELAGFCAVHIGRRNAELHSSDTPFDALPSSSWLASFYRSCDVLLESMGHTLEDLVGADEANVARKLVSAAMDTAAQVVGKTIEAHKTVWAGLEDADRGERGTRAAAWAVRSDGHVVKCPACGSRALVDGEPITPPQRAISEDDQIIETQQFLPTRFECVACGLKISGLSHLNACGLGDPFKHTNTYDAATYYAPEFEDAGYDDDNNEPF